MERMPIGVTAAVLKAGHLSSVALGLKMRGCFRVIKKQWYQLGVNVDWEPRCFITRLKHLDMLRSKLAVSVSNHPVAPAALLCQKMDCCSLFFKGNTSIPCV